MAFTGGPGSILTRNDGLKAVAGRASSSLGLGSLTKNTITGSNPWDSLKRDAFFPAIDIDAKRWNQIYPYRLLVIDVTQGNRIVNGDLGSDVDFKAIDNGGIAISFKSLGNSWEFQLPITPQQISVVDQFAISTTATMRGVVEEHNGIKFKIISASGTTGIWPNRNTLKDKGLNPSSLQSLLGGTIEAFGNVVKSIDRIKNTITTGNANNKPTAADPLDDFDGQGTGYYQAQLLQQFLEQYAMAKKDPKNKGWRLVFDYPKENQAYVVTPLQYSVTKNQRSPGEHLWAFQLKAWKRIELSRGELASDVELYKLDTNFFQRAVNSLNEARRLTANSLNLVKAVRSDFRKPFDALRQATLFIKNLGGVAFAASDLPNQIISDIQSSVLSYAADLDAAFGDKGLGGVSNNLKKFGQKAKSLSSKSEGVSTTAISFGALGISAASYQQTDAINGIFQNPEGNFEIFNQIPIDSLILAPDQIQAINDEVELTSLTSIEEIREIRDVIQNLMLDISNNFGAGDEDYSRIFGRPEPRERSLAMTPEEFEILAALENVILDLNILTSTRQIDDARRQSSLEFVGGLASDAGIVFNSTSPSKFLAPVPYNLTIQEIAARYLGNPDRWIEIATLNNLRSPYLDEDGFFYNFLSNGDGRQFNIATNVNLYIGQSLLLSSSAVNAFSRKIIDIQKITDSNYLISVDGLDNLDILTLANAAKMQAYLPGTVNSQNQIWIPTEEASNQDPRFFDIPYLTGDTLTGMSKIDWLMDERGDLVINAFGDFRVSNGLTNIMQALRMKVMTQRGKLMSFPEYGIGLTPGVITSELDVQSIFTDLQAMIQSDPRFETIENLVVTVLPPEIKIEMSVRLANGKGIFPINFTLKG